MVEKRNDARRGWKAVLSELEEIHPFRLRTELEEDIGELQAFSSEKLAAEGSRARKAKNVGATQPDESR